MAESLPSPPRSRASSLEIHDLSDNPVKKLDLLLEQYLTLVDHYTALRDELSATFSSGFFSLAQAQRTSSLGPGRRYGQDFYDERMKASRKLGARSHTPLDDEPAKKVSTNGMEGSRKLDCMEFEVAAQIGQDDFASDLQSIKETPQDSPEEKPRNKQSKAHSSDPLKWFGILVPPALRQTQTHFTKAVEQPIPQLVSVQMAMNNVESEIWKVRRELDIVVKCKEHPEGTRQDLEQVAGLGSSTRTSIPSKQRLPIKAPQPKTNVLKLDA